MSLAELIRKVCVCGDPGVGKTSLVRRFVTRKYDESYISTLGTVISKKKVNVKNDDLTLMIWDISGQPEFKQIHAAGFQNAVGGLAVCDVTRPETAEHLRNWVTDFRKHAGKEAPVVVLTNKSDLPGSNAMAMKAVGDMGCPVLATSAKTGENVEEAFKILASSVAGSRSIGIPETEPKAEMPDEFGAPGELLDYLAVRVCEALKDQEMGMYVIRKQSSLQGIDPNNVARKDVEGLAERLVTVIKDWKGQETARELNSDLKRAFERCRW